MIAPLKPAKTPRTEPSALAARRAAMRALMPNQRNQDQPSGRRVAEWKAWLLTAWMVATTVAYLYFMLRNL